MSKAQPIPQETVNAYLFYELLNKINSSFNDQVKTKFSWRVKWNLKRGKRGQEKR